MKTRNRSYRRYSHYLVNTEKASVNLISAISARGGSAFGGKCRLQRFISVGEISVIPACGRQVFQKSL